MPRPLALTLLACVIVGAALQPACNCDPGRSAVCQDSIHRGSQMLAVPDVGAARDWLAQARQHCGAAPPPELAALEQQITDTERWQVAVEEARRRAATPKSVTLSVVPAFVEAVVRYRDTLGRETCDDDRCSVAGQAGPVTLQLWTKPKEASVYAAFATFPGEHVACEQLGRAEVKRTWKKRGRRKLHCALLDGALAGLSALVVLRDDVAESDVTVFVPKWPAFDVDLGQELGEADER